MRGRSRPQKLNAGLSPRAQNKNKRLFARDGDLVVLYDELSAEVNCVAVGRMAEWEALVGGFVDALCHIIQDGVYFLW